MVAAKSSLRFNPQIYAILLNYHNNYVFLKPKTQNYADSSRREKMRKI